MFQNLYKQNIDKNERQEIRRKDLLHQQKLNRLEQQDEQRLFEEPHDRKAGKFYYKKQKNTKLENIYLQLSEWLKEKPEDFNDWLLVPCPKGQRCLVVSGRGETKMFSKNKRYRMTFSSLLPGGGILGSTTDSCILDCIYNKELDMFYVLDALHLYIPLMDCDAEFRFFWLKSKFGELEDSEDKYKNDDIKSFQLLNYYDMSNEERIAMALQKYPLWSDNQPQIDGFLFYHKESHYVCGSTPLVCWLFPFMIPDVLQMAVSCSYKPPEKYCNHNPWQYMNEFDKEMAQKHYKRRTKQTENSSLRTSCSEFSPAAMEEELETMEESIDDASYIVANKVKDNSLNNLMMAEKLLELEEYTQ